MSEKIDLDALEALETFRHREEPTYTELMRDAQWLASALESTLAELRRERERAEEAWRVASEQTRLERDRAEATEATLSRAEETIEKFEGLRLKLNADADYRVTKAWAGHQIHAILTEYGKQKGADRG